MRRVYVHQFGDLTQMPMVPLAAGQIVAAARLDPDLAQACRFELVTERDTVDPDRPWVLAFSIATWNLAGSLRAAARSKRRTPEAPVILGGPSVPRDPDRARRFLERHPQVDVLVFGEGEIAFRELLIARLQGRPLAGTAGTAVRTGEEIVFGPPRPRIRDFSQTASPYLDGTFDDWCAGRPNVAGALLETNRGCPFRCTFCDWGQATASRVNELPIERIRDELAWIAERGIPYVYVVDANFGIRPRDHRIVAELARLKALHGAPRFCYFHLTKNVERKNLLTAETLLDAGIDCHVAISMQSYEPRVLAAIERDNISLETWDRLRATCAERGIPTSNELLLGLPEQSYDGFTRGVVRALSPWPRDSFFVYPVRLIENAAMASDEQRARFGLVTREVTTPGPPRRGGRAAGETEELVVGSASMNVDQWRRAFAFAALLGALANLEIAGLVVAWLRFSAALDVHGWMEALLDATSAAVPGTVFAEIHDDIAAFVDGILAGGGTLRRRLPGLPDRSWEAHEAIAIRALRRYAAFCDELRDATRVAGHGWVDTVELAELFEVQRFVVPAWDRRAAERLECSRDWSVWQRALHEGRPTAAPRRTVTLVYRPPEQLRAARRRDAFVADHLARIYGKLWRPTVVVERDESADPARRSMRVVSSGHN